MFKLSRDPVVLMNLVAALIAGVSAWLFPLTVDQQALLNAGVFAIANVVAAFRVGDGQVPALMAGFKAIFAIALGFGLHLSPEKQTTLMVLVAAVAAAWMRTQVVSPEPAPAPPAAVNPANISPKTF